ncbi:MAG: FAD-dependent oxidoreductase, partial [Armatimonadetes bacterium]|nr:FAD-dependent oxidoreductase [Armatimonadota bacterium]
NVPMPNRKTDTNNNGAFSTDNIGMNYEYPDGDHAARQRIIRDHLRYQKGLMYFLANDPRVPQAVREGVARWGLAKDEFRRTDHWPHQLYIREARRMVAGYVMTEHDCRGAREADDPVGLAAYTMDSHNTQRCVDAEGRVRNEGDVQIGGFAPYPISYRSIIPRHGECANLLVPVCLSASHIAYGSIRMEPVFMILGQSAATAAVHAIEDDGDVQDIDYARLRERLLADRQVLAWTGPRPVRGLEARALKGTVVDDLQATFTGAWATSTANGPFVEAGYRHDGNAEKGEKSARFEAALPAAGRHEVRLCYAPNNNRATTVPVTIEHADGATTVLVNQREAPPIDGAWVSLGTFAFAADRPAVVTIGTTDTEGHVIADAVQFVPQ